MRIPITHNAEGVEPTIGVQTVYVLTYPQSGFALHWGLFKLNPKGFTMRIAYNKSNGLTALAYSRAFSFLISVNFYPFINHY
ncbi:hypothetical protein D0T85_20670 [Bacteroides sp. 519]|nr:hypothetical protein [Bacteroides sp. 519]